MSKAAARLTIAALWAVLVAASFLGFTRAFTSIKMEAAIQRGAYPTAKEAMLAEIEPYWVGIQRVEFEDDGTVPPGRENPHVTFVVARVYAEGRIDGTPIHEMGYDYPGSYFLDSGQGWVLMPETDLPDFVGWGMKFFHLYGCAGRDAKCQ